MKLLSVKLRLYLLSIYMLTFFSVYFFLKNNYGKFNLPSYAFIIFFGILIGLTESFTVVYRGICISTSFAVTLATYILCGPETAIIVVIIGLSISVYKMDDKYQHIFNIPFYKTLFNYCMYILPILYGDYFFIKLGGIYGVERVNKNIFPIVIFCFTYFLLNVLLFAILFSITTNKGLLYNIVSNVKLMILNFFAMAPLGILAAIIYHSSGYLGFILFTSPIVLVKFTFSQYIEAKSKYVQTVDVIMHAMEARDKYTEGHSKRVAELAGMIARELKYNDWKIEDLNIASLLHDVGKIGIDDRILNKPGKLTDEEYNIIKKHPEIGYKILEDIKDSDNIKFVVKYHHERYDGKGYPEGKKAGELSLDIFIVQLADSIDAMETDRPYRKGLTQEEVISEVKRCRGTQFHPDVVDAYLRAIEK